MATAKRSLQEQFQSLAPSAIIELFQLELTEDVNGVDTTFFYHAGTNEILENITWNGDVYSAVPCKLEGFSKTTRGTLPKPTFEVANTAGAISAILVLYNPLNAKLTRIRTCKKFLDAVNFTSGTNPSADPTAVFDPDASGLSNDIWYIDRVSAENSISVTFELTGRLELTNLQLPKRQVLEVCPWKYKGTQCGYKGKKYFDVNDNSTSEANDVCGHRYTSCLYRFGNSLPGKRLPFGGFPGARLQM
tara:strand:+ start:1429 stop:2169 length:741 start_codon:yes stop_codon:yes gene_type:complete